MTIDLRKYTPGIYVDLKPGVYSFSVYSATGKTYLYYLLRKLRRNERVDSYTYIDDFHPKEFFDRTGRDLVMLDRYELYAGEGDVEMWEFARTGGIVLVSCKSNLKNEQFSQCGIILEKTGIAVYDILSKGMTRQDYIAILNQKIS